MEQDLKAEGAEQVEGWAEAVVRAEAVVLVLDLAVSAFAQTVGQKLPMRSEYHVLDRHARSAALP
ncbi:MAG: hypothetical protein PVJ69_19540 [Desulfobacteraceae bacterium]|jgi:hypothetical protein